MPASGPAEKWDYLPFLLPSLASLSSIAVGQYLLILVLEILEEWAYKLSVSSLFWIGVHLIRVLVEGFVPDCVLPSLEKMKWVPPLGVF